MSEWPTPEATEAAIQAWDDSSADRIDDIPLTPWSDEQRGDMEAALVAAEPFMREQMAREVDDQCIRGNHLTPYLKGYMDAVNVIAARIRAGGTR